VLAVCCCFTAAADPAGDRLFPGCRCRRKSGDPPHPNFQAIVHHKSWRKADALAYIGQEGLMDFSLPAQPQNQDPNHGAAIILACVNSYFATPLRATGAHPMLWTNALTCARSVHLKERARWLNPPRNRPASPRRRGISQISALHPSLRLPPPESC